MSWWFAGPFLALVIPSAAYFSARTWRTQREMRRLTADMRSDLRRR